MCKFDLQVHCYRGHRYSYLNENVRDVEHDQLEELFSFRIIRVSPPRFARRRSAPAPAG